MPIGQRRAVAGPRSRDSALRSVNNPPSPATRAANVVQLP